MAPKPAPSAPSYSILIVGAHRAGLRDLYHALLRMPWWAALAVIVGGYLLLNALFAALYLWSGGIANAAADSFVDAFYFSVQTMGTIGYGSMYPTTRAANNIVVAESVTGLVVTALATGLVFVRFSHVKARVMFSDRVALAPIDGVPTLMIRVGNERGNEIVDAILRLVVMRTSLTSEGVVIYRSYDLKLVRERAPALSRAWIILHRIEGESPLCGDTPESFEAGEAELTVSLSGIDDTSLQPVHAMKRYAATDIAWGSRLADILSETPDGNMRLDVSRFHDLTETTPTERFPYPRK